MDEVLITAEFLKRLPRARDAKRESEALELLTSAAAARLSAEQQLFQAIVEICVEQCHAGSAGISIAEQAGYAPTFRWAAAAGAYEGLAGRITPNFSPCGFCVAHKAMHVFSRPDRYFTTLKVDPPMMEVLVLPWQVESYFSGTIWIAAHDEQRKLDPEDARLMQSLANFAAAAVRGQQVDEVFMEKERKAAAARLALELRQQIDHPLQVISSALYLLENESQTSSAVAEFIPLAQQQLGRVFSLVEEILNVKE